MTNEELTDEIMEIFYPDYHGFEVYHMKGGECPECCQYAEILESCNNPTVKETYEGLLEAIERTN